MSFCGFAHLWQQLFSSHLVISHVIHQPTMESLNKWSGPVSSVYLCLCYFFPHIFTCILFTESTNSEMRKPQIFKEFNQLCADHDISTGGLMMNLVSNFECLFQFFSLTLKSDLKEVQFNQKSFLLIWASL